MSQTTSRYPLAELKDVPEDIREQILKVQEKAGFIPECVRCARATPGGISRVLRLLRCVDAERKRVIESGKRNDRRRHQRRE